MSTALVDPKKQVTSFAKLLDNARPRIAMVIPRDMSVDRVIGVVLNETGRNEKLRKCDPGSIVRVGWQWMKQHLRPATPHPHVEAAR